MDQPWIYLVLLGGAIIVLARFVPQSSGSDKSDSLPQEIEETLTLFAAEMEQDNEKLLQTITGTRNEQQKQLLELQIKVEQLQTEQAKLQHRVGEMKGLIDGRPGDRSVADQTALSERRSEAANGLNKSAERTDAKQQLQPTGDETAEAESSAIRTRYASLFKLREEGKSIENIARKLGMNKGEVDLIIQLAKREESAS